MSSSLKNESSLRTDVSAGAPRGSRAESLTILDSERTGGPGTGRRASRLFVVFVILGAGVGLVEWRYAIFRSLFQVAIPGGFAASAQSEAASPRDSAADRASVSTEERPLLTLSGYVVPRTQIRVGPRVPGTIVSVPVEEGSRIKKGELLAQIEDTSYQAESEEAKAAWDLAEARLLELKNGALPDEIEEARADLDEAKAQLELKRKELDRATKLNSTLARAITAGELDIAAAEFNRLAAHVRGLEQKLKRITDGTRPERVAAAQAQVDQARALARRAEYFNENAAIVAPVDGTILEKHAEIGEIVRPDVLLSEMFLMADLSHLEVQVDVQERDMQRVEPGQPCRIVPDAYPERGYRGRLDRFQPQVNRQRAVIEVRISVVDADEFLRPHMNCRVEFFDEPRGDDVPASEDEALDDLSLPQSP